MLLLEEHLPLLASGSSDWRMQRKKQFGEQEMPFARGTEHDSQLEVIKL